MCMINIILRTSSHSCVAYLRFYPACLVGLSEVKRARPHQTMPEHPDTTQIEKLDSILQHTRSGLKKNYIAINPERAYTYATTYTRIQTLMQHRHTAHIMVHNKNINMHLELASKGHQSYGPGPIGAHWPS